LIALQHHPVFSRFKPFSGVVPPFCLVDYLGTKIRHEFLAGFGPGCPDPQIAENRYPEFDEEYFEWIDLCEAVVAAKGSFTMIELGAGFGRWSVRAAHAMKQYHPEMPYRLIAVEAEPTTFQWMRLHFQDNGIDPDTHTLMNAAVSDKWGRVQFYIGGPPGGPIEYKAGSWYGQALTKSYEVPAKTKAEEEYCGYQVQLHESGWKSIRVMSVSLRGLLKNHKRVDLVDIDIEGEELPAVRSSIEQLDAKVKRLHIGTHEKEIEVELRRILSAHGWQCLADYPLFSQSDTPFGSISFQDGAQSWVNPRLE
jgi:FkbM family methyltransferase